MPDTPHVFLSGTREDLEPYREAAKKAIIDAGCFPRTMEHFPAKDQASLDVCLAEVGKSDAVVVIVAHRYGWIPPEEQGATRRSITWRECAHARGSKPVFAFLVDENHEWPEKDKETYRATEALNNGRLTPVLTEEIQDAVNQLKEFKRWLATGVFAKFTSTDSLRHAVLHALTEWKSDPANAALVQPRAGDPVRYLDWLRESTRWIDLRGLKVGSEKANRFEIERLYVHLTTAAPDSILGRNPEPVRLEQALERRRLVVIQGDAGSGKTTFLRKTARQLLDEGRFPLLIRIPELDQHIVACWERKPQPAGSPTVADSPQWIRHYLASRNWDLDEAFFEARLRDQETVLLLDGLDEAANDQRRASMARLFAEAAKSYPCRIVVTTRPQAYRDDAMLAGWEQPLRIDELDDTGVDEFLRLWSRCLHAGNDGAAEAHRAELRAALDGKPEIRRMTRNPVMLTALAVVHWNDKRLPEQRSELYESVLGWLAKAREQKEGRESSDDCLRLFGRLALGMQEWPQGHRVHIGKDAAAGLIQEEFRNEPEEVVRLARAHRFLATEEIDSGIVTSAGSDVRFWHRTFQEHLAARTLAGVSDAGLWEAVEKRLHQTEWREVILLLGGLLHSRGRERLDWLIQKILETTPDGAPLPDQARTFGLLGAILRDLGPVDYHLQAPATDRFAVMRDAVMAIFTKEGAGRVGLEDRVAAAEALGQAGDPRLRLPAEEDYWVKVRGSLAIGRYPVTVYEFAKYVDASGKEPQKWEEQLRTPSRPVVYVDWDDANAYCTWVGSVRLPTDDEWTLAAAGSGPQKRAYPWGDDEPDEERANYENKVGRPTAVGLFPKGNTPEGVADMAGNVWEWTSGQTVRGGAFYDNAYWLRATDRSGFGPGSWDGSLGFRLVRE